MRGRLAIRLSPQWRHVKPHLEPALTCTAGCLSLYPTVSLQFSCCDLSVRAKDWFGKP